MRRGKTQAMLEAAVNSPASLVVVYAHNEAFARDLERRCFAMLEAGEGDRPEGSEMRFMGHQRGDNRLRGLDAALFVDHHVRDLFLEEPRT